MKPEDVPLLDALRQLRHSPIKASDREDADEDSGADEDRSSPLPSPAPTTGLSDALLTDLHAARTVALRLEVAQRPDIALRLVAHSLAAEIVTHETTAARISLSETYIPAISKSHCPDDEPLKARIGHWKLRLPGKAGQLWGAILALSDQDLLDLIAVCAAISIDATHSKFAEFSNKQRMANADQLATTLQLDMTRYWTATAEGFFSRVTKATIREATAEAAGEAAAADLDGLKKPAMAVAAEKAVSDKSWLPAVLRTTR